MLTIVIQAGGESKRMGTDKALIPFLGRPLIERVISQVRTLGDEIIIITNKPGAYQYLNLPLVKDVIPGRGALGGLYTALYSSREPLTAIIACDMPFANAELLSACRDLLIDGGWDAVIPRTARGAEPFHAVYRREICLEKVEAAVRADRWKVNSWFAEANIRYFEPKEAAQYDPDGRAFMNLNTPEDVLEAEGLINR